MQNAVLLQLSAELHVGAQVPERQAALFVQKEGLIDPKGEQEEQAIRQVLVGR